VGGWGEEDEADVNAHRLRNELPVGWPTAIVFGVTVGAMLVWGFLSVFWFAEACSVDQWQAWIPAVATTGTMLVSSAFAAVETNTPKTRTEGVILAGLGVAGDVVITYVQHYLAVISKNPQNIHPGPYWGGFLGAIPSLMAAILIHLGWQVWKDYRETKAAALAARIEAARARDQQAQADAATAQARADELAEHARHEAALDAAAQREAAILREQRLAAETSIRADEAKAQVAARETQLETTRREAAAAEIEAQRLRQEADLEELLNETRGMPAGSGQPDGHPERNPQGTTGPDRAAPDSGSKPAPDVTALLPVGREIAAALARDNVELTRPTLQKALKARSVPCGTDRAAELLRQLRAEPVTGPRPLGGRSDRRLSAVTGR
jgi:hypothetical protein